MSVGKEGHRREETSSVTVITFVAFVFPLGVDVITNYGRSVHQLVERLKNKNY